MDLIYHLIASSIIAAVLFPFFGWVSLAVLIGGFLIDIDHYLYYVLVKKDFDMARCRSYFHGQRFFLETPGVVIVFHTLEFVVLVAMLAIFIDMFRFVLLGLLVHIVMDIIHSRYKRQEIYALRSFFVWLFLAFRHSLRS